MKNYIFLPVVLLLATTLTGCYMVVEPGERGIEVTQGRISSEVLGEGGHTFNPITSEIKVFDVKQVTKTLETTVQTSDLQTITVHLAVMYSVPEGSVITLYRKYSGEVFETLISPRVREAVKAQASTHNASQFIQSRERIKAGMMHEVSEHLEGLVVIEDISITETELSQELQQAIEGKQVKQEQAKASFYDLERAKNEAKALEIKAHAMKNAPQLVQLEFAKRWDGKLPDHLTITGNGTPFLLQSK